MAPMSSSHKAQKGAAMGIARSTFPFVPAAVDTAPDIPVAAAGGVGDGRGLAAALMLGADGVLRCLGMSASPPTPDVSLRGNEPTLRANALNRCAIAR